MKEGMGTEGERSTRCPGMERIEGIVHNTAELLHCVDCRVKREPGGRDGKGTGVSFKRMGTHGQR